MKQSLLTILFIFSLVLTLSAQDAIYTVNGNRIENARLTDVSDGKVSFVVPGKVNPVVFQRQNVLIAFSNTGNFLVVSELGDDLTVAKQRLLAYQSAPPRPADRDYLIRAVPLAVIAADISYETETVVNYKTRDGKSASISKGELIGILYRNGRHTLLGNKPSDVAPLLVDVGKLLAADISSPTIPSTTPSPASTSVGDQKPVPPPKPVEVLPVDTKPEPQSANTESSKLGKISLNETDYQFYRKKALQKVDEFVSYLNVIMNKKLSASEKDNAIAQAARLFMPAATIEVTSSSRPGSRRYPIREYLTRLKLLPYSTAKIEWSEIQYMKELSQAADGNYYGLITGQQTFVGYGDQTIYSDVVKKNVRVKLEQVPVTINGNDITKWNLLLGSVGVSAN